MEHAEIFTTVRRNLSVVLPDVEPDAITLDRSLADLGCNSVDRAEVVTMTMADLGIWVPVMEFQNVTDMRTLTELFAKYT